MKAPLQEGREAAEEGKRAGLYEPLFQKGPDTTPYRHLGSDGVKWEEMGEGQGILRVDGACLELLISQAFDDMSHLFRRDHLESWGRILQDATASENDRYVAHELLRNAVIASQKVFPSCQDTGTAIIIGWKGEQVWINRSGRQEVGWDEEREALSRGVFETYRKRNLRYSQLAPLSMYEEVNTGSNLPAQIQISAVPGAEYRFLCIAKGGGSANKTFLYQKTRALLKREHMHSFLSEALVSLGTAACPPYHLAVVVGGLSAEHNLHTLKLASCRYYEDLPTSGNARGRAFRDAALESEIMQLAKETGIGAQFGGEHFVHSVRVIRLPRHGASLAVGVGVSCSADRQILGKINRRGIFIEQLEEDPARFLQSAGAEAPGVQVDLEQPISEILSTLDAYPVGTRVMLRGTMIVARDVAHARLAELLERTGQLPEYMIRYPVYYAGPAKTPEGYASGSFGPTSSQRMDPYVPMFQKAGASLVMLGKGNRSRKVVQSCKDHGGFYLGSIGGPAARLGRDCITSVKVIDYPQLGMEAVWQITVKDFPAFIITDNKGSDFFLKSPL